MAPLFTWHCQHHGKEAVVALGQPGLAFPFLSQSHLVSLVLSVLLTLAEDNVAPSVQKVLLTVSTVATTHIN